jgi:hypothetical protein
MKKSQDMIQTIQKRPRGRPRSIITDTKPGTVQALDQVTNAIGGKLPRK